MLITLTTDFGLSDAYVAAMKGVILSTNPQAKIIDLCHTLQPHDILGAAFLLSISHSYFPQGTIHIVIVDPGVGSKRRAVLLVTPSARFLAPDNGVLSYIIERPPASGRLAGTPSSLGANCQAFSLNNPRYWRTPVSPTFHGRDIFAPVAAHLSLGIPPHELGESIPSIFRLPRLGPHRRRGMLVGQVIHVDHFGNLITDIREADLEDGNVEIEIKSQTIRGLSRYYAQGGRLQALIGGSGHLEIASKESNASLILGAAQGEKVIIRWGKVGKRRRS